MAKSHKKKGKKHRSKTTLPPVKESTKQNGAKIARSNSIPPANQQKQHRKRLNVKKASVSKFKSNGNPPHEGTNAERIPKTTPSSTSIVDAFSNLSLNDKDKRNSKKQSKRRFSTDTTGGKNDSRKDKSKRQSLEDIAKLITSGKAKNIVIMAGAGISTDSGIPDFRTPGTGLYDNLKKYKIPSPTAIFDLDYFHHDPKPFFALAKELYPSGKYKPCIPHYFVKLLQEKGLLLRMYTQNIDGLERIAGIPSEKLVEAHGTFATASCTRCGKKHDGLEIKNKVLSGIMPRCSSSGLCWGIVKPDIVFFGEDLPRRFYYYLKDFPMCDLLIIMGTSLEVEPFASLTSSVRFNCPRLLLNRELVGPFRKRSNGRSHDVGITGDLAETINRFANLLGWQEELDELIETAKPEEATEGKSDTGSTDSGVSSSESLTESTKKHPSSLLPPDNDMKRYFHTVRSTPLPKSKSTHTDTSTYSGSYFSYIRDKTFPAPPKATEYTVKNMVPSMYSTSSLPIQYAQTVRGKKRNKVTTFGAGTFDRTLQKPNKYNFESSDSDSSNEDISGSTDTLSTLTSDDSSS